VVDVPNLNGYKSSFIAKADGVKVYIFYYEFGYIMCVTDPESTMISPRVSTTHKDLSKILKKKARRLARGDDGRVSNLYRRPSGKRGREAA
jgi:ABC-type tungstate transport system permease subunit